MSLKKKRKKVYKKKSPIVLRRPLLLMHSPGFGKNKNNSCWSSVTLTVACGSKSCINGICHLIFFFFWFFFIYCWNWKKWNCCIRKWTWKLKHETKPIYIHKDPLSCTGFTGQQTRALALDFTNFTLMHTVRLKWRNKFA